MNILKSHDGCIILGPELNEETKVFRYLSFSRLMNLIENKQTTLTRITSWEDTWELPSTRVPVKYEDGPIQHEHHPYSELMFGLCWSLHNESDAMWRIYSPDREGVVIQTTVKKFRLLKGIQHSALGKIIYYDDIRQALNAANKGRQYDRFAEAFLKRRAFEHEKEVRFVTAADSYCIASPPPVGSPRLNVEIDPINFIEGIKVDPRAKDEHVEVLRKYCARVGLDTTPTKSTLYGDLYKHTGLVIHYKTVKTAVQK